MSLVCLWREDGLELHLTSVYVPARVVGVLGRLWGRHLMDLPVIAHVLDRSRR